MALPIAENIEIAENEPVFVGNAQLEELDYRELYRAYSPKGRKSAAEPRIMFKLLVYGYMNGIYSTRKLEQACRKNIDFIWLLQGEHELPFLLGDAELDADRSCAFGHVAICLLQTTTDIFSEKNRGLPEKSENKMLPALEKAEASCSADMRFERTASTAAARTQRRNERSGLSASLLIGSCWEYPNPVDFM